VKEGEMTGVHRNPRAGALLLVLGVTGAVAALVVALAAPDWHTKVVAAAAVVGLALTTLNTFLAHYRGPEIRAHEPSSIVMESDWRHAIGKEGSKLWLYVPLTFTNDGSVPGVVAGLQLVVHPTLRDPGSEHWQTDWPGANDPVEKAEWEPNPIQVLPHGSEGRTVKLCVRHYLEGQPPHPAAMIGRGPIRLTLEALVNGTWLDMKWEWSGNVSDADADALRAGKDAGPGPPQIRVGRQMEGLHRRRNAT